MTGAVGTHRTIAMLSLALEGFLTIVYFDCMLFCDGLPLNSLGFVNQLLKFRWILRGRQVLTQLLLQVGTNESLDAFRAEGNYLPPILPALLHNKRRASSSSARTQTAGASGN